MKNLFIALIALTTSLQINAQLLDPSTNSENKKIDGSTYFQKAKNQKSAAWVLLGVGTGLILGSAIDFAQRGLFAPTNFWDVAGPAGLIADLASIPLFIISGKNKRKANLMVKDQAIFFNSGSHSKEHLVAIGAKINL